MINVTRGDKPTSLDNPAIQSYLDKVASYNSLEDDDRKNASKPESNISYRNSDVLEAFDRNFHSKCYLTEQKFENSWAMDIEHFRSKAFGQFPELKYEWTNLYPCSHDANMAKPRNEPDGGYLDPCVPIDDVEKEIIYTLEMNGVAYFDVLNKTNIKAVNTCKLLDKIHNGTDDYSIKKTGELRHLIHKKEREVIRLIMEWLNVKGSNIEEEIRAERKIKNILSRKSDFTMLLRSLSCVKKYLPEDFLD
ncbi:hypothetical protein LV89_02057 [Arcicella aurantiaca]|uniref:TIGR02646 family protein n=1 Tax=Arcicella aurantiaca TaxID=591202 RepID=A0A316EDW8_9BACT|nr:hypothetical protein [Arcicella aurantiaca]PWK26851.1 hypothetical protein LV89_02057 [Arcicella aurantiaca]